MVVGVEGLIHRVWFDAAVGLTPLIHRVWFDAAVGLTPPHSPSVV